MWFGKRGSANHPSHVLSDSKPVSRFLVKHILPFLFQLPYYIPPVVLANLINLVFFVFLLFAVEVVPTLLGLLMRRQSKGPEDVLQSLQPTSKLVSVDQDVIRGGGIRCVCPLTQIFDYFLPRIKDSFINLDQDISKAVKISGQVESTVQDKITQKWIQIFWLYFLPLKI